MAFVFLFFLCSCNDLYYFFPQILAATADNSNNNNSMEGSVAYPSTANHQPSSFGIDNILTGISIGGGASIGGVANGLPTHNHYRGCDVRI